MCIIITVTHVLHLTRIFLLFRWKDADGLDLPSAGRVYTVDGVLSISDAVQSDSGKYRCIARNIAGSRNSTAWIVVSSKCLSSTELMQIVKGPRKAIYNYF